MTQTISIVIPTFNSIKYSGECVASALVQTYPHLEVVVDDNISQDGTGAYLIDRFGRDERFKIVENREDLNIPNGWNRALSHARGDYVLLLHSDNLLHPQYAQIMLNRLEQYRVPLGYSECHYFEGQTPGKLFHPSFESQEVTVDVLGPGPRSVAYVFRFQRMVPTSCLLVKRSCFERRTPFNPEYEWDPDMELLSELVLEHGVLRIHEKLAAIRTHPDQAPNWRQRTFSSQYYKLLKKEHELGKTERHHFLLDWASSNEDMTRRLAKVPVPKKVFFRFFLKWLGAEFSVFRYFTMQFLRKTKQMFSLFFKRQSASKKAYS